MKRTAGLFMVMVLFLFGLAVSGCSKKQETSAPAPAEKPAAAQKVNMQEGKWEITNTMEMQGMPAGMMKPHTFTTCLSQKDYVPKDTEQKDCSMKTMKIDGDTVNWEVVCKDSSGKGRVTYAGSTFDGVIEMMMKDGGKEMNAKMTMKGKHIGPCTP
ncbi:MAG: DUF3617 family protein [Nitrospirae bacterium]|nr:MAG: DUF3617 family protein [Nitrospirota bacterium]